MIAGLMFADSKRYCFLPARDEDTAVRDRGRMLAEAELKAKAAPAEAERRARDAEERRRVFKP